MSKKVISGCIEYAIILIRGKKVMIDHDLAALYGVETKYLNRQVRRNMKRFPKEFMFKLTQKEKEELVTNWHRFEKLKHSSSCPYAFTEHGVAMLASILNSPIAIRISIHIVKTFIRLRELILDHKELALRIGRLEGKADKQDDEIQEILEAIRELLEPKPEKPKKSIGFHAEFEYKDF